MKKSEEQLANELDAFLTTQLNHTPPTTPDAPAGPETQLAADLLNLTKKAAPDSTFVAQLETHLHRVAAANSQKKVAAKQPSFRQQLFDAIKEQLIMKRTIYALGGLAALVIIGFLAWNAVRPDSETTPVADIGETAVLPTDEANTDTPLADADSGNTVEQEPAETPVESPSETAVEIAELPLLPKVLGGGQAQGRGGGGGAANETAAVAPAPGIATDLAIAPYFTDIFSNTQFVANTALPTDITQAPVWQQTSAGMELADAQQIANAFGFTGPLYILPQPVFEDEAGIAYSGDMPVTYFAFDGSRTLTIDAYGTYYRDDAVSFDFEEQLPLEQIAPIAEAFVQANGMIDFPYVIDRYWGNEVLFFRQIDGRSVNQAEVTVTINDNGEIAFASNQKLRNLTELGSYPLRTAEEAFQLLQEGILQNNIWYTYTQADAVEALPVEPAIDPVNDYRSWQHEYQAGAEAHLYTWPSVYLPANGEGTPRVEAYPFMIQGSDELMQGIAANPNQQFHFWGIVGEDGRILNLAGFEPIDRNREPIFVQGTVRNEGDQTLFETQTGETYIIPDAPADLPADRTLNLFGWALRDIGAAFSVVDWESIDLFIEYPEPSVIEEPIGIIEDPFLYEPYVYQEISITGVELIYAYSYIYPEFEEGAAELSRVAQMPTIVLQPAWKFTGTADNGDQMEFVVEAVAPEYVQN
ncbi:MAG: hypothetical protein KC421_06115 [Anaerolineales bacterium]|nr:hypothetical protein [Anaerolineales bacterium]